jgi:hypothetical protein
MIEVNKLFNEDLSSVKTCEFCQESSLGIGIKTDYGAVIIYRIGEEKNGWFATLSPKTGGHPKKDFTIQLMPISHLTHFSQMGRDLNLSKNYGVAFSKLMAAATEILGEDSNLKALSNTRESGIPLAAYGKCTTWKEKKEHLHLKIFPFRGNLGQPFTVDSSYIKLPVHKEKDKGIGYVKMNPVSKKNIHPERFDYLSKKFIELL